MHDRTTGKAKGILAVHLRHMRLAIRQARHALGETSPNPMVGALIVSGSKVLGRGYHHKAGLPHAEVEAIADARKRGYSSLKGATLYVTLEPCSTHGRTPPCTEAIIRQGFARVVVGATDPNPKHQGAGLDILRAAGIEVISGVLEGLCSDLNREFNHWILKRQPLVTIKAAMTLDGKIATIRKESKWLTNPKSRAVGMELRRSSDAILVGINTIIQDDPALTVRPPRQHPLKRVILDSSARIPISAQVLNDDQKHHTIVVTVKGSAPRRKLQRLSQTATVLESPSNHGRVDLHWLLDRLGLLGITSLLVEGGGIVLASFLESRLAHRTAFFYAPKIFAGRTAAKAVSGEGFLTRGEIPTLVDPCWTTLDEDLFLAATILPGG